MSIGMKCPMDVYRGEQPGEIFGKRDKCLQKEKYNVSLERRKYGERRSYAIFHQRSQGHRAPKTLPKI